MKKIIILFLILIPSYAFALGACISGLAGGVAGTTDYCTSQSWATYTTFKLDFDHTTDEKTACLASGTEVGTFSANAGTDTPSLVSPGSGGKALYINGNNEYITFDNSAPYFRSSQGQLMLKFKQDSNPSSQPVVLSQIIAVAVQDRILLTLTATGLLTITWEDNNGGGKTVTATDFDMDNDPDGAGAKTNYYGVWVQVKVVWNTALGSNEVGMQWRADMDDDGNFDAGGTEDWSAIYYLANEQAAWSSEPDSADAFDFGGIGTYEVDVWLDDVEISYTAP